MSCNCAEVELRETNANNNLNVRQTSSSSMAKLRVVLSYINILRCTKTFNTCTADLSIDCETPAHRLTMPLIFDTFVKHGSFQRMM